MRQAAPFLLLVALLSGCLSDPPNDQPLAANLTVDFRWGPGLAATYATAPSWSSSLGLNMTWRVTDRQGTMVAEQTLSYSKRPSFDQLVTHELTSSGWVSKFPCIPPFPDAQAKPCDDALKGTVNADASFTPFFDALLLDGLRFENGQATLAYGIGQALAFATFSGEYRDGLLRIETKTNSGTAPWFRPPAIFNDCSIFTGTVTFSVDLGIPVSCIETEDDGSEAYGWSLTSHEPGTNLADTPVLPSGGTGPARLPPQPNTVREFPVLEAIEEIAKQDQKFAQISASPGAYIAAGTLSNPTVIQTGPVVEETWHWTLTIASGSSSRAANVSKVVRTPLPVPTFTVDGARDVSSEDTTYPEKWQNVDDLRTDAEAKSASRSTGVSIVPLHIKMENGESRFEPVYLVFLERTGPGFSPFVSYYADGKVATVMQP